jgi:hypothetical protein
VSLVRDLGTVLLKTVRLAPAEQIPKCPNDKTCYKHGKTDFHYMTDCPCTTKDAAVELLAKHRAANADKPKDAFTKIEATK